MQKARRFTCSTVCQSSPSNTSVRTRKTSRAASVGSNSARERVSLGVGLEDKTKSRSNKCNLSLLSSSVKPKRKAARQCRTAKPNAGSLQNAVVLAPFYTLKKCFQNKLMDLYTQEKLKKHNQKTQMAKKKNTSFEYDIIELKPTDQEVKKEGKSTKKSRPKSRSTSYCQCDRVQAPRKEERKVAESSSKQKRKVSNRDLASPKPPFVQQPETKRRKLNPVFPVPTSLKYEAPQGHDFHTSHEEFPLGGTNQGSSVMSSRSKCESWETYSNSPSCREELMQGSLAISTTSFDSYLEHFDKGSWDFSESGKKCNSRMQKQRDQPTDANVLPKPTAKDLLVNAERTDSDGEILDFMDREPQAQVFPSAASYKQWRPLRRQSKTKQKKSENNTAAATSGYYLRSSSKENDAFARTYLSTNQQSPTNSIKTIQVEVGTQFEEINQQCPTLSGRQMDPPQSHEHSLEHQTQEQPSCELDQNTQEPTGDQQPLLEPPQEQQQPSEYFDGQREDAGLGLLGKHSMELMAGFSEHFQGPSDPHQPQDKDYIFGPRNSSSGLGESCEFSFGLKWVLSDDED